MDGCNPNQEKALSNEIQEVNPNGLELVPWVIKINDGDNLTLSQLHHYAHDEQWDSRSGSELISQSVSGPSFPPGFEDFIPEGLKVKARKKRRDKEKKKG